MKIKIREILKFLQESRQEVLFTGILDGEIDTMCNLQELEDHSICWIKNKKFATDQIVRNLKERKDLVVVCPFKIEGVSCIITDYPKGVFFSILNHFFTKPLEPIISERAVVLTKRIGKNVSIGPNCYVGEEVEIGDNTILHPNVSILSPCRIGCHCEIFSGVVIGADGFGYYMDGDIPRREIHFKGVVIGDYVEVGANTSIDRGLLNDTVLCNHVKVDNLCHIGHNVRIEENSRIVAGTIICGSVRIGRNAYLAPGSVVMNHIQVGEHAMVGVNSAAMMDVKEQVTVFGTPARRLSPRKEKLPDSSGPFGAEKTSKKERGE